MPPLPPLSALGRRICVFGPSGGGKSTLTLALAQKLGLTAVHMDQLRFLPHTDWQTRPRDDFAKLYFDAVAGEDWVIDGNYRSTVGHRLKRATGLIFIDTNRWANVLRYLRRTLFQRDRPGAVAGAPERVKWSMIRWILVEEPANRAPHIAAIRATGLPFVRLTSFAAVKDAYRQWQLPRPGALMRTTTATPR